MSSRHLSDVLLFVGASLITAGTSLWSIPLALIVAGIITVSCGVVLAYVNASTGAKSNAA